MTILVADWPASLIVTWTFEQLALGVLGDGERQPSDTVRELLGVMDHSALDRGVADHRPPGQQLARCRLRDLGFTPRLPGSGAFSLAGMLSGPMRSIIMGSTPGWPFRSRMT